jgi:hypothetical protein
MAGWWLLARPKHVANPAHILIQYKCCVWRILLRYCLCLTDSTLLLFVFDRFYFDTVCVWQILLCYCLCLMDSTLLLFVFDGFCFVTVCVWWILRCYCLCLTEYTLLLFVFDGFYFVTVCVWRILLCYYSSFVLLQWGFPFLLDCLQYIFISHVIILSDFRSPSPHFKTFHILLIYFPKSPSFSTV